MASGCCPLVLMVIVSFREFPHSTSNHPSHFPVALVVHPDFFTTRE